MTKLREKFITENLNKWVKLIFKNGYQLRCRIIAYDDEEMVVATNVYSPDDTTMHNILVSYSAVAIYIPSIS